MTVHRFNSQFALYPALAAALVEIAEAAVAERGMFRLALNGGGTPGPLFELLAAAPLRKAPFWPHSQFWWGDERCIPPDAAGSNYRMAEALLLDPLGIAESQVRRMRGELEPFEAAVHYSELLRRAGAPGSSWPRFDLVLLGLGTDGHTASLFPGSIEPEGAAAFAVTADYAGRPAERVTLSSAVINDARNVFWMVVGAGKRGIVEKVLDGPRDPLGIPAQRIMPVRGEMKWWVCT